MRGQLGFQKSAPGALLSFHGLHFLPSFLAFLNIHIVCELSLCQMHGLMSLQNAFGFPCHTAETSSRTLRTWGKDATV